MVISRLWSLILTAVFSGFCIIQYFGFDSIWFSVDFPKSNQLVRDLRKADSFNEGNDERYFSIPFHGVKSGAGLGNQLFEIFALIGIANSTNRIPIVNIDDAGVIGKFLEIKIFFPDLIYHLHFTLLPPSSMESISIHSMGCCRFSPLNALKKMKANFVMGHGIYFQSHLYFSEMRESLLSLMNPSLEAISFAKTTLNPIDLKGPVVCVHARRGDFLTAPHPMASEESFTRHATQYVLDQHIQKGPATVLLFSNDPVWILTTFNDVIRGGNQTKLGTEYKGVHYIIPNTTSPHLTLIMARLYCNTVLITAPASTFAWFMGFLSDNGKGKVFYSEHYAKKGGELEKQFVPKEFHLPHWIPLRMHKDHSFEKISVDQIQPY